MRVYRHPDKPGWVLAQMETTTLEIERSRLPTDSGEALALLRTKLERARQRLDEEGNPIPPPAPPEPEPELDLDDEAVQAADFDALADKAAAEIEWLEATISLIDAMALEELRATLKRVARENMETLRAWRYVIQRLG